MLLVRRSMIIIFRVGCRGFITFEIIRIHAILTLLLSFRAIIFLLLCYLVDPLEHSLLPTPDFSMKYSLSIFYLY
jgi:hypothetical protein